MERTEFKKLLFNVAFCAMACDGHIDNREIEEMKVIDKNTTYFGDIDLSEELNNLIKELNEKGKEVITELLEKLKDSDLNTIQELLVLEIALRIVNADEVLDENEINFVRLIRSKLKLHDEIIKDRFGIIDYLVTNRDYLTNVNADINKFDKMDSVSFEVGDIKGEE